MSTPTTADTTGKPNKRSKVEKDSVTISKGLSKILRHQALNMGLTMSKDGFISLADILALKGFTGVTLETIESIVDNNSKKRFELVLIEGAPLGSRNVSDYKIRAVQGHSIDIVEDELLLEEVTDDNISSLLPQAICVHGTYRAALPMILKTGLNRMSRNHIHLAIDLPENGEVISGLRSSAEIAIFIDINKARAAGIQFFVSKNKVVLSKGLGDSGAIPSEFFHNVIALDGKPFDIETYRNM